MSWGKYSARNFQFGEKRTPDNLGPGSYNIQNEGSKIKHKCKTTFGTSQDSRKPFGTKPQKTPDPSQYNLYVTSFNTSHGTKLDSKSKRSAYTIYDNPSPADYSKQEEWIVTSSRRKANQKNLPPPPLTINYGQDIAGFEQLPNGTLRAIPTERKDENWIGPGAYNIPDSINRRPKTVMASARPKSCLIPTEKGPGPGQYTPREISSRLKVAINEFHSEKAHDAPLSGELKHGDLDENVRTSPFKSRTKRELWKRPPNTPGPQKYSGNKNKGHQPSTDFAGLSERFKDKPNGNPGPGAYEAKDARWMRRNAPTVPRAIQYYRPGNGVPGPGTYQTGEEAAWEVSKVTPSPPFATTANRNAYDIGPDTPGPAAYTPRERPRSGQTIRAGSSKRTSFLSTSDAPSPEAYDTRPRPISRGRGSTIGNSGRRNPSPSDTPGPGSYAVDHDHDNVIKPSYNSDLTETLAKAMGK